MLSLKQLQDELSEAVLAVSEPPAFAASRAAIYRHLVAANLDECMRNILPRTTHRLGEVFFEHARRFYAERGPQTHYLRDVPAEFLVWVAPHFREDPRVPPFMLDLARHEAVAIEVSALDDAVMREAGELLLDRPAVFAPAARVVHYEHAVHELSLDPEDRTAPDPRPVSLLVYRDAEHELRYLALSPAAAAILTHMLCPDVSVADAITRGAADVSAVVDEALLTGTSTLLADLAERGVLLGGAL